MSPIGASGEDVRRLGAGREAEVLARDADTVVKLFWAGCPRATAELEAHCTRVAAAANLPVCAVGDVVTVGDRVGIVFERADGPSMQQAIAAAPRHGLRLARLLGELHARTHDAAASGLPSQRARLAQQIADAPGITEAVRQEALAVLATLPDGVVLCHGDLHPLNVIMTPGRLVIIDWAGAVHGHPLADVARTVALLRYGTPVDGRLSPVMQCGRAVFTAAYLRRYRRLRSVPARDIAAWELPVLAALLVQLPPEERRPLTARIERLCSGRGTRRRTHRRNRSGRGRRDP